MNLLIVNEGLNHIAATIFQNLDLKALLACRNVNSIFRKVLNCPTIWINRLQPCDKNKYDMKEKWLEVLDKARRPPTQQFNSASSKMIELSMTNCLVKLYQEKVFKNKTCHEPSLAHIAARFGEVEFLDFVKNILSEDDFNYHCSGYLPIHEAGRTGQLAVIEYFHQRKADIFVSGRKGYNIVHLAAANGHLNILKYVYQSAGDYYDMDSATSNGKSPIYLASENNHLDVVKYLLSLCKDILQPNHKGLSPLHIASKNGNLLIVQLLAKLTEFPNAPTYAGMTPIHFAAWKGHIDVLKILVPISRNILLTFNIHGWNPLHLATLSGNVEVVKYLCENSDLIEISNPISGANAVHYAACSGYLEILKFLVPKFRKHIIIPSSNGLTPIHSAVLNGHSEVVEYLYHLTSTPNQPIINRPQSTPLELAKSQNNKKVVDTILRLNRELKM